MVLVGGECIRLEVQKFLMFHLKNYLEGMGTLLLVHLNLLVLVLLNRVIYFFVNSYWKVYYLFMVKSELCVWMWGMYMFFQRVP